MQIGNISAAIVGKLGRFHGGFVLKQHSVSTPTAVEEEAHTVNTVWLVPPEGGDAV